MNKYRYGLSLCWLMFAFGCSESHSESAMMMSDSGTADDVRRDGMTSCGGEICELPETTCQDENTLLMFGDSECDPKLNECTYSRQEIECEFGCVEGACLPAADLIHIKDISVSKNRKFGSNIAADDNTLIVGGKIDSGDAVSDTHIAIFTREDGKWVRTQTVKHHLDWQSWGYPLAIDGDVFVVGGSTDASCGEGSNADPMDRAGECKDRGAAEIFERGADGKWTSTSFLKPEYFVNRTEFARNVDVSNGVVYVNSVLDSRCSVGVNEMPWNHDNNCHSGGAIYTYRKVEGEWVREDFIKAPTNSLMFGVSFGVDDDRLVVSVLETDRSDACWRDSDSADCTFEKGGLYVLDRNADGWSFHYIPQGYDGEGLASRSFVQEHIEIDGDIFVRGYKQSEEGSFVAVYEKMDGFWNRTANLAIPEISDWAIDGEQIYVSNRMALCADEDRVESKQCRRSGAVYRFEKNTENAWERQDDIRSLATNGRFGTQIVLSSQELFVSSEDESSTNVGVGTEIEFDVTIPHDGQGYRSGAVYVLGRSQIEN